jgi:hypothetical protein
MVNKPSSNNYCKLIKNFDVKKSAEIYANFEKELNQYSELTLVNFIVEYYNKSSVQKLLEEYGCHDILYTVENVHHKILQFKKILDITEKENVVEKLTIEKCITIINDITDKSKLKGGRPFRQFIRNIFRRLETTQFTDFCFALIGIVICCMFVDVFGFDRDLVRTLIVNGVLLVPIIARLIAAGRMHNIPDNVFDILYDLIYRNTDRHRRRVQIVSFNQYAQWHIEGIDLLHWLPTFSDQMIRGDFERDNLRRIYSELNLFRSLVETNGWIALANDDSVDIDLNLALRAHIYDIHNRQNPIQQPHLLGPPDYLIIRRASDIPDNISNENRCNICYEDLIESNRENDTKNENGYLVRLHQQIDGVAHLFHFKCIKNWFLNGRSRSCPLCRQDIDFSRVLVDENIPENEDGIDFFDVPSDEVLGNE